MRGMKQLILVLPVALALTSCQTVVDNIPFYTSKAEKAAIAKAEAEEQARVAAEEAKKKAAAAKAAAKKKIATQKAVSTEYGLASWYSVRTNNGNTKTASGRPLSNNAYTAAHKTLPFGSKVRVTSRFNGKSEILTITDRGPYVKGRIIDVTIGSAKRLGFYGRGVTKVKVEVLSRGNWKYRKP